MAAATGAASFTGGAAGYSPTAGSGGPAPGYGVAASAASDPGMAAPGRGRDDNLHFAGARLGGAGGSPRPGGRVALQGGGSSEEGEGLGGAPPGRASPGKVGGPRLAACAEHPALTSPHSLTPCRLSLGEWALQGYGALAPQEEDDSPRAATARRIDNLRRSGRLGGDDGGEAGPQGAGVGMATSRSAGDLTVATSGGSQVGQVKECTCARRMAVLHRGLAWRAGMPAVMCPPSLAPPPWGFTCLQSGGKPSLQELMARRGPKKLQEVRVNPAIAAGKPRRAAEGDNSRGGVGPSSKQHWTGIGVGRGRRSVAGSENG